MTETKNYLKEFYSGEREYGNFFRVDPTGDERIAKLQKQIKKLQKEIQESEDQVTSIYSRKYSKKYEEATKPIVACYRARSGSKFYYAVPSGIGIDIEQFPSKNDYYEVRLDYKTGEITTVAGFCYELASVIFKNYKYSISGDNSSCKFSILKESLIGFLEDKAIHSTVPDVEFKRNGIDERALSEIDASEFISKLYGVPSDLKGMSLYQAKRCMDSNANFEMIIKTAPNEIKAQLLEESSNEHKTIPQLIGISKECYEEAIKRGLALEAFEMGAMICKKDVYNKTDLEWLDMIEKSKSDEEDFRTYSINFDTSTRYNERSHTKTKLIYLIANWYENTDVLRKYYSFGKLYNYAVKQCIDQGYTHLSVFLGELRDYLRMCDANHTVPTLYSSYLKMTHDIASRNQNIRISPDQELAFKTRYIGYVPFKKDGYIIMAPTESKDLISEGNQLNHCVASYIKRVIDGESLVYFMRSDPKESLITLEIKNGIIEQARGMHNRQPDEKELATLKKFAEEKGLICNY